MSKKTLKELREAADAALAQGVANRAALVAAVPVLVQLQEAADCQMKTAKECKAVAAALSAACSKYGLDHSSAFDEGLFFSPIGVKSGDLTVDEVTYHFSSGYADPKRTDGESLTQAFLAALPKEWTKDKKELDVTGINRLNVSDKELEKNGLYRPEKNTWKAA